MSKFHNERLLESTKIVDNHLPKGIIKGKGVIFTMKRNAKFYLSLALILCFLSSLGAALFQTDVGTIKYYDMTFVTDSGHELDALLLVPKNATAQAPAPGIVVSHGWYNNREMQDLNYVEYARRGFVVMAISMYGHGDSEALPSNTWWDDENNANGLYDAVKHLARLPFVNSSRIGVTGHSNGALACREAVLQDEEGLIAAALLVSNDAVYYNEAGELYNQFGSRDAAIIACQYDEFFHRVDGNPPREYIHQVTAQSFLHFGADPAGLEKRNPEEFYVQNVEGEDAIRAIFTPAITHPWAHFSADCVAFGAKFFDAALDAPVKLEPSDQIWQWKAALNALGVVGFFMFALNFALVLLELPFFQELKGEGKPLPTLEGKAKKRYLTTNLLSAFMSIVFYFIAFVVGYLLWNSKIWNQGASRIIGLWSLLCGLFTLWMTRICNKHDPVDREERGRRLTWEKMRKSILLAVTVVFASFGLVFLSDYLFLTDYRLWCFATIRAFDASLIPAIVKFAPFWLFYYIAMSVSGNCHSYTEGRHEWSSVARQMFFVFLGPQLMILVQYGKFFITGKMVLDPITGIMGIWLFPIVLILPLSAYICHKIYKKTNNPYIGGIIMGLIACILTVTNTLTG